MVLLGLILVAVAVAAGVLLVLGAQPVSTPVDLDLSILKVSLTPLGLLVAGAAVLLLLWLGLAMIRGSVKRRRKPTRGGQGGPAPGRDRGELRADERARAEETHQAPSPSATASTDEELQAKLRRARPPPRRGVPDQPSERDHYHADDERSRASETEARIRADERAQRASAAATPAPARAVTSAPGCGRRGGWAAGAAAATHHDDRADAASTDTDRLGTASTDAEGRTDTVPHRHRTFWHRERRRRPHRRRPHRAATDRIQADGTSGAPGAEDGSTGDEADHMGVGPQRQHRRRARRGRRAHAHGHRHRRGCRRRGSRPVPHRGRQSWGVARPARRQPASR